MNRRIFFRNLLSALAAAPVVALLPTPRAPQTKHSTFGRIASPTDRVWLSHPERNRRMNLVVMDDFDSLTDAIHRKALMNALYDREETYLAEVAALMVSSDDDSR